MDSFVLVFQHWFAYRQGSRRCGLSQALCCLSKLPIWSSINLRSTKLFRLQKQHYGISLLNTDLIKHDL
jgi:hypothetical protein